MHRSEMYRVNVSSVQDFYRCRFRWWCKWVMNRVPVATSPALDAGKLLHVIFEDHFKGQDLVQAARSRCAEYRGMIVVAHPAARHGAEEAVQQIEDLIEAFPLWTDGVKVDEVLEVEEPFEWEDPKLPGVLWIGRPDNVIRTGHQAWHRQNRGLAAGKNFATYARLAERHYHEHLYGEVLSVKYDDLDYGGTQFNLVRKLKFRTNVGKKNEKTKTAPEMFYQQFVSYSMKSPTHLSVMKSMRQHVVDMMAVEDRWNDIREIPGPNEDMNGGYSGNSEDPFFRLLIGEAKLSDDAIFKDREDPYAT